MDAVKVARLSVQTRRGIAVCEVSFAVAPGEAVALFGGSGAGKSSLLRVLAGRTPPAAGTVVVLGRAPRAAARRVGFAAEEPPKSAIMTPHLALSRSLAAHRVPGAQRPARLAEALETMDLYDLRDRPLRELSHTQRAAVAVAAAIAPRPALLLLDDLLSLLPAPGLRRLQDYLSTRRRDDGLATVTATTRSEEAECADRVLLLDAGEVVACGAPTDILSRAAWSTVTVEADDPQAVRRTLRGVFDVQVIEGRGCLRFAAADGEAAAAHLLRHPTGGVRVVHVRRPDLWDALGSLAAGA